MNIVSIYNYFLADSLESLSRIPLENQLKECLGLKIAVVDMCGVISKYLYKFIECDVFIAYSLDDKDIEILNVYDVVYIAVNELQYVYTLKPFLKIVCVNNRIQRIEAVNCLKKNIEEIVDDALFEQC